VGYGEDLDHVIAVINRVGEELAEDPEWGPDILETPYALRVQASPSPPPIAPPSKRKRPIDLVPEEEGEGE